MIIQYLLGMGMEFRKEKTYVIVTFANFVWYSPTTARFSPALEVFPKFFIFPQAWWREMSS